jgi:2-polyprenyl-3-methyl-5-hydroxy-6-metoxy-1,4-benzoquinol methylase
LSLFRNALYQNYFSKHVVYHCGPPSHKSLIKCIGLFRHYYRRFLPSNKDAAILEIGCGKGEFLYYLRQEGYQNILGIDLSSEQIAVAENLTLPVQNIDCVHFLENDQRQWDLIVARHLVEHFSKIEALYLTYLIYERLNSGGRIIIEVPNCTTLLPSGSYSDLTHDTYFNEISVAQLLRIVDFANVEVFEMGPYIHGLKSLVRTVLWKVIKAFLRGYLIIYTAKTGRVVLTDGMIVTGRKAERS